MADTPRVAELRAVEQSLHRVMDATRRSLTLRTVAGRLLRIGCLAALWPLGLVVADHLTGGLPRWAIAGAGLGLLALTIMTACGVSFGAFWRRLHPLHVAFQLEREYGIRHNAVANLVAAERAHIGAYAADAAVAQAARAINQAALETRAAGAGARRWMVVLAIALTWVAYAWLSPKPILPSLARMLGFNVAAPTATRIERQSPPDGAVLHVGDEACFAFALRGRAAPRPATFRLKSADGATLLERAIARDASAEEDVRGLTLAPAEVADTLRYEFLAGDAREAGEVVVVPQPRIESWRFEITPPAYTGESPESSSGPEVRCRRGATVRVTITANCEPHEPVFVFRGAHESRTRMSRSPDRPRQATATFEARASGVYHVELIDEWGYAMPAMAPRRIVVQEDTAPTIEITRPDERLIGDGRLNIDEFPLIEVTARDDIGLRDIRAVVEQDGARRFVPLEWASRASERAATASLPTSVLDVRIGGFARVWFEATDNHELAGEAQPQTGVSSVLALEKWKPAPPQRENAADESSNDQSQSAAGTDDAPMPTDAPGDETEAVPAEAGDAAAGEEMKPGDADQMNDPMAGDAEAEAMPETPAEPDPAAEPGEEAADAMPDTAADDEAMSDPAANGDERSAPSDASEAYEEAVREFAEEFREELAELRERMGERDTPESGDPPAESDAGEAESPPMDAPPNEGQAQDGAEAESGEASSGAAGEPGPASDPGAGAESQTPAGGAGSQPGESEGAGEPGNQPGESAGAGESSGTGTGAGQSSEAGAAEEGGSGSSSGTGENPGDGVSDTPGAGGEDAGSGEGASAGEQGGGAVRGDAKRGDETGTGAPEAGAAPPDKQPEFDPSDDPISEPSDGGSIPTIGANTKTDVEELIARADEIAAELGDDLDWSAQRRSAFTSALERLRDMRIASVIGDARETRIGGENRGPILVGGLSADGVGLGVAAGEGAGGEPHIAPPAEQETPADLDAILKAYYESMAAEKPRD